MPFLIVFLFELKNNYRRLLGSDLFNFPVFYPIKELEKFEKKLAEESLSRVQTFCLNCAILKGPVAQLNSASDFGSEGWGFESLRGHLKQKIHSESCGFFLFSEEAELVRSF